MIEFRIVSGSIPPVKEPGTSFRRKMIFLAVVLVVGLAYLLRGVLVPLFLAFLLAYALDPMVDTRGGAFTVGLGLVPGLAVIPRVNTWSHDKVHRTVELAPKGVAVVGIPEATALVRDDDGWRVEGVGECVVYVDGEVVELSALP